ncbi:hypothetical protein Pmani_015162 [Petrolisthes manimaculis]|uniref:Fork-head domain-containing protein n=1 Tax=Petrolisthes manimaculis TaxID=1843537 RepID=A0AAE1PRE7_9EUCA|nr:hypothetical protein Pmani_015162 [Petrolisthes manimaculis]
MKSYVELIGEALQSSPSGALTLAGITRYLRRHYAFFRGNYQGWRNSIRHNLSLNQCFRKILRDPRRPYGKDNLWTVDLRFFPTPRPPRHHHSTTTTTTPRPPRHHHSTTTTTTTPRPPHFHHSTTTTPRPSRPRLHNSTTTTTTPRPPHFHHSTTTTTSRPRFDQSTTATTTPRPPRLYQSTTTTPQPHHSTTTTPVNTPYTPVILGPFPQQTYANLPVTPASPSTLFNTSSVTVVSEPHTTQPEEHYFSLMTNTPSTSVVTSSTTSILGASTSGQKEHLGNSEKKGVDSNIVKSRRVCPAGHTVNVNTAASVHQKATNIPTSASDLSCVYRENVARVESTTGNNHSASNLPNTYREKLVTFSYKVDECRDEMLKQTNSHHSLIRSPSSCPLTKRNTSLLKFGVENILKG